MIVIFWCKRNMYIANVLNVYFKLDIMLTSDKKAPTQHSANRLVLANRFHTCVLIWLMTDFCAAFADSMVSTLI